MLIGCLIYNIIDAYYPYNNDNSQSGRHAKLFSYILEHIFTSQSSNC